LGEGLEVHAADIHDFPVAAVRADEPEVLMIGHVITVNAHKRAGLSGKHIGEVEAARRRPRVAVKYVKYAKVLQDNKHPRRYDPFHGAAFYREPQFRAVTKVIAVPPGRQTVSNNLFG
jgi:hypothetical protein